MDILDLYVYLKKIKFIEQNKKDMPPIIEKYSAYFDSTGKRTLRAIWVPKVQTIPLPSTDVKVINSRDSHFDTGYRTFKDNVTVKGGQ